MDQRCVETDQNGWDRSRYNRIDQMMGQDLVKWIKQVTQDRSGCITMGTQNGSRYCNHYSGKPSKGANYHELEDTNVSWEKTFAG